MPLFKPSRPDKETVLRGLFSPSASRLRLDRFPRDSDCARIAVALGPTQISAAELYIKAMLREAMQRVWRQPVQPISEALQQAFDQVVDQHHDAVLQQTLGRSRIERMQLFQLASLKLFLAQIDNELALLGHELEDARSISAGQRSSRKLELHRHAVLLAQHRRHVRYRVARRLIRERLRYENARLCKVRDKVLGVAWPLPEAMLAAPIVQLDGFGELADFSRNYPMLLHDSDAVILAIRALFDVVSDYLPPGCDPPPATPATLSCLPDREGAYAQALLELEPVVRKVFVRADLDDPGATWVDAPENASTLFGGTLASRLVEAPHLHPGNLDRLQRALNGKLARALRKVGLLQSVEAAYATAAIAPTLGIPDIEGPLFEYLRGADSRAEMKRRLASTADADDASQLLRRIDGAWREFGKAAETATPRLVARFAGDCLRFRRDLKLAWQFLVASDQVRLVTDERERRLAMEKDQLQVFCRDDRASEIKGNVVGHVIVSVDIRGATALVAAMGSRSLQAASYFSRHLYEPVAYAIEQFGAEKLAVSAASLQIALFERASEDSHSPVVARACCLAMRVLAVIDAMNMESARIGLPDLEVGMGVAYTAAAPAFVADQNRKVAISPALDRAATMALCDAGLRESAARSGSRGLCVAAPVEADDEAADSLLRCNVFAIELDAEGFCRLSVELPMRRIRLRQPGASAGTVLHAGYVTDLLGVEQLVLVRENRVRLRVGRTLVDAPHADRSYYEVVSDERLRRKVRERLPDSSGNADFSASTTGPFAR